MKNMLDETSKSVDNFKSDIRNFLENEVSVIIGKVARTKSDNDIRHSKVISEISQI